MGEIGRLWGAGMVSLCAVFQSAGVLPTVLVLGVVALAAGLASTMLAEAMTQLPGNDVFQSRAEIITLAQFYFYDEHRWAYWVTVVMFVLSLIAVNVASIIIRCSFAFVRLCFVRLIFSNLQPSFSSSSFFLSTCQNIDYYTS